MRAIDDKRPRAASSAHAMLRSFGLRTNRPVWYWCLFLVLLSSAGCASVERLWLYRPAVYPQGEWQPESGIEDAWFQAADGTQLHGWFVPCPDARVAILFAHGRSGNVTRLREQLRAFCERHDVALMVFDYRGFGKSEGVPSEQGLYQDARAARQWLAHRTGFRAQDVVLMGRSLGAAVVIELAAEDGARGLIVESAFTSLPRLVRDHLGAGWLCQSRFDSLAKIQNYHGPLLVSHGDRDRLIPFKHGLHLHKAANLPKQFVRIPDAGHFDPQSEEYHVVLDRFLHGVAPP